MKVDTKTQLTLPLTGTVGPVSQATTVPLRGTHIVYHAGGVLPATGPSVFSMNYPGSNLAANAPPQRKGMEMSIKKVVVHNETLAESDGFRATRGRHSKTDQEVLTIQKFAYDSGGIYKRFGQGVVIPMHTAGKILDALVGKAIGEEAPL